MQARIIDVRGQEGANMETAVGPSGGVFVPRFTTAMCTCRLLRRRLLDPEGAGMVLRPDLEAARAKLFKQLSATVETPGANTSYLIIGARGTGKSLVRLFYISGSSVHQTSVPPGCPYCATDMALVAERHAHWLCRLTSSWYMTTQMLPLVGLPAIPGSNHVQNMESMR